MLKVFNLNNAIVDWLNDYAPQGILTTDTDLVIRGWNRWLEQHSGRSVETTLGCRLFDIFPELVERRLDRFYVEALNGEAKVLAHRFHRYLVKLPAKSEYRLAEMQQTARIAPLVDGGRIVGTITAIEDVSERVVKEDELNAARHDAEDANRAKDRFLAMLSHDLRTPLSAILGWSKLIRGRTLDAKMVDRGLESIERNAGVQLQLIEEILDISRIAAGKLQLELESVDVKDLIAAALDVVTPMAEAKGIRIERSLPAHGRIASADPKRFQQIVWNLVSNAVKFTPDGGHVRVSLVYEDKGFELRISDTGVGIAAEDIVHIFEPLWQAGDSGAQGGLGLGLSIVQELVGLHGGTIRVDSPGPGQGATFTVRLPWPVESSLPLQACE